MLSLIIVFLFALAVAYFAIQNAIAVPIVFASSVIPSVPLYFVVIASILAGIILASVISSVDTLSAYMKLRGKESKIHDDEKAINNLQQKVHDLELENAQLKSTHDHPSVRDAHPHIAMDDREETARRSHSVLSGILHPHARA